MPKVEMFKDLPIVMLTYKTQNELARAFVRVQEFYESPAFKGTIFTLGQFREWYAAKHGTWSYYKDWNGFNVPSKMFELFIRGTFDPLSKEEKALIKIVKYIGDGQYVIATHKDADNEVGEHELAHALYACDRQYRSNVDRYFKEHEDEVIESIRNDEAEGSAAYSGPTSLDKLIAKMNELGYNDTVVRDECHAYLAASTGWLRDEGVEYPMRLASNLRSNLLRSLERE